MKINHKYREFQLLIVIGLLVLPRIVLAEADAHAHHRQMLKSNHYSISEHEYAIPKLRLLDSESAIFETEDLQRSDKLIALNFIFTTCTTICPVMTSTFAHVKNKLGKRASEVIFFSVTIDPEFDRPEVLKSYAENFDSGTSWRFLTGDKSKVDSLSKAFDAYSGSKLNHRAVTLLKRPGNKKWVRLDGLVKANDLTKEIIKLIEPRT